MNKVTTRERGVIPGCVPTVPNSASQREWKWPEQDPYVKLANGERIRMSVASFLREIKNDVEQSRERRGAPIREGSDPWATWGDF